MGSLDDSSYDHQSFGSASSFQVQLMRCGFLPQNSVSSFDLRDNDLEELELKDADNQNEDEQEDSSSDHSEPTTKPCPRRGLIKTLSFRLSRRNLMTGCDSSSNDCTGLGIDDFQQRRDSRSSQRNHGLKKRVERERRLDRSPTRGVRRTKSDGCAAFGVPSPVARSA